MSAGPLRIEAPTDAQLRYEGRMLARVGDWIIRGVQGEFYQCKPDIERRPPGEGVSR